MKYDKRGVSAEKNDVHEAIKHLDKGLFPKAFCKVLPDYLCFDDEFAVLMHADTAGTKTSLAYLYWRETGDISVWKGIVQDAIVMNMDDLACSGAINHYILSSTIGRNRNLIGGEVISTLISAVPDFADKLKNYGINIYLAGGETADVGDLVRTLDFGVTITTRLNRKNIIEVNPLPGDVIVGFSSSGQTIYEDSYNSGIGSNGLTFARHETLSADYAYKYPESFDPNLPKEYVYTGKMKLSDATEIDGINVGKLLLSPTRTYLPLLKQIIPLYFHDIHGIVHCTGGGQTKILHFIENLRVIKDNLFDIPPVFRLIQQQSNTDWYEMFKVFNMGHRLEIYCKQEKAAQFIEAAAKLNIEAKIVGYFEKGSKKEVIIRYQDNEFFYPG